MRLKKVTLFGFKSFANRTTFEFHPGITCIVGPNGCGKSNVADAFRWVLGEQSAKSLRGHKMQDVIFAGTTTRPPLHLAEVTFTLTDVQGALPIEFDEVAVTRRLHRSGESEYLLNGTPVRLKDLQALFFDSGIGKEAFSIFEQGKIDQVIHYTPLERRTIFEEAAGIVRFLHRKREALRKLEQTDLNLSRVEDVLNEVRQRITVLEQQATRALEYKERKALFEMLERQLLVTKWNVGKQKLKQLTIDDTTVKERVDGISGTIQETRSQLHQARVSAHECELAWKSRSADMYSKRNERDLFIRDRSHISKRREELLAQIRRWEQEMQELSQKTLESVEEKERQKEIHEEMRETLTDLRISMEDAQSLFDTKSQELEDSRAAQEEHQRSRLSLTQNHSSKLAEWKQIQARMDAMDERLLPLEQKIQQLNAQKDEVLSKQQTRAEELKKLSDEVDAYKGKLETLDNLYAELKTALAEGQTTGETLIKQGANLQARLKALQDLREALEGFSPACKKLIEESTKPSSPFFGKISPLYEVVAPVPGNERACAAILQPYGQTLVVPTREDLNRVLDYIKKHQLKDIALFCTENAQGPLSKHFLGDLHIVETLEEALLANKTTWAQEGALVDAKKVLFFEPKRESNAFMREAEIAELQDNIDALEQKKIRHSQEQRQNQERIAEVQLKRTSVDKEMRTTEMKLVEVNYALLRHQADVRRVDDEITATAQEQTKTKEAIADHSRRGGELQKAVALLEKQLTALETSSQQQQAYLEELSLSVKRDQAIFENARKKWQESYAKERQQLHAIELLAVKEHDNGQRTQKLRNEITQAKETFEALSENTSETGGQLEELQKIVEKLEGSCAALEKTTAEAKQRAEKLEEHIRQHEEQLKLAETDKNKLGLQLNQLTTLQEALTQAFRERYNEELTDEISRNTELLADVPAAEKQMRSLKQELDATQDVNMLAIEECAQDKHRSKFLGGQVDDLKSSKHELIKVITELDTQSRKLFQETFQAIRTNFQKNFAILFNGGEADLHFVEGEDLLEAGIEISAKPPGKQMRSISLLSGGEKCLTAMALLFAIFEVKPSPYCFLDEIDAPLDDSNVERFLNVVKQFIDRCQFIIITHNKRTMAIADRIYGVSMQERGISKLLSMEFSQVPDEATGVQVV